MSKEEFETIKTAAILKLLEITGALATLTYEEYDRGDPPTQESFLNMCNILFDMTEDDEPDDDEKENEYSFTLNKIIHD